LRMPAFAFAAALVVTARRARVRLWARSRRRPLRTFHTLRRRLVLLLAHLSRRHIHCGTRRVRLRRLFRRTDARGLRSFADHDLTLRLALRFDLPPLRFKLRARGRALLLRLRLRLLPLGLPLHMHLLTYALAFCRSSLNCSFCFRCCSGTDSTRSARAKSLSFLNGKASGAVLATTRVSSRRRAMPGGRTKPRCAMAFVSAA